MRSSEKCSLLYNKFNENKKCALKSHLSEGFINRKYEHIKTRREGFYILILHSIILAIYNPPGGWYLLLSGSEKL